MHEALSRLAAAPEDEAVRHVTADALEEAGDPRGEYLRLELELAGLEREPPPRDWSVRLEAVAKDRRIETIKAVREVTWWGLKEAKDAVDAVLAGTPSRVTEGPRTRAEAEVDKRWIERVPGATVALERGAQSRESRHDEVWSRLCGLSKQLDPEWLRQTSRLFAVWVKGPSEQARELADARLGTLTHAGTMTTFGAYFPERLLELRLRDGLRRAAAEELAGAVRALGVEGCEVRVERSRCSFAWPCEP